jgi:hypothetical protein
MDYFTGSHTFTCVNTVHLSSVFAVAEAVVGAEANKIEAAAATVQGR